MYYVYILRTHGDRLYTGSTNNLSRRSREHNRDKPGFRLLAYIAVGSERKARELEKYLETGSGRAFLKKRVLTDDASA